MDMEKEQMNIVIVGHVDHGKSTVIGRLLADTNSLPQGKLEQVKKDCERNSKPFEYAFLLDALKDERSQGITIDTARCFFKTQKRHYIIIDAPGHIEFLKNMVTGASRAEAALLVIDAKEGVRENTKRHGLVLSMLGIKQVSILVNKMDLVDFSKDVFQKLVNEYTKYLNGLKVVPKSFIPISAFQGENLVTASVKMKWYQGASVLEQLDQFSNKPVPVNLPFRFPVQDVYKFTEEGDERRIFAGTVETGKIRAGDEVVFLPSGKKSNVVSIESFNTQPKKMAAAGEAVGFTLSTQVYIRPGEMMAKVSENNSPKTHCRFKSNIFWVGTAPMIKDKIYRLKVCTDRVPVKLIEVVNTLDAEDLSKGHDGEQNIKRHDVAACILETVKPIAYDLVSEMEGTSRFVVVDQYEIAGGGVILESIAVKESVLEQHVKEREQLWDRGLVSQNERTTVNSHKGKFIIFASAVPSPYAITLAKKLERKLFDSGCQSYYLGFHNLETGLDADSRLNSDSQEEQIRRLGELGRILTDAGQLFITTMNNLDTYDVEQLKRLTTPYEAFIIQVGETLIDPSKSDFQVAPNSDPDKAVENICARLKDKDIISEYSI